jgi:hypothetical protein
VSALWAVACSTAWAVAVWACSGTAKAWAVLLKLTGSSAAGGSLQNDTKAICMGILDTTMRNPDSNQPANDQEFVLYHTEGIESMGFTNHLKLPHYVTFQSSLKNVREEVERKKEVVPA